MNAFFTRLCIAHFMGMHALQILPLLGYYVFRKPAMIMLFSAIYFFGAIILMLTALYGMPLLNY